MDVQLLIEYIVRQTTVLLAQLSTTAGVRAPLAHVADQVFLELAREIEAQGVRRKVVADMFGLALRSYQLKVQRLEDSARVEPSLWQRVHSELGTSSLRRSELLDRLSPAEPKDVAAVLNDLVDSGLAYCSGRGQSAIYGLTSESDRERFRHDSDVEALASMLWLLLATGGSATAAELSQRSHASPALFDAAIGQLKEMGRVAECGEELQALSFHIPVGAEQGWEAAVCNHFQAVATAIAAKLTSPRSREDDTIGGATLMFTVHPGHPHRDEVLGLLASIRQQINALWTRVSTYNAQNPPPEEADKVTFYCGQNVVRVDASDATDAASRTASAPEVRQP
jgi:hypothetical protein